MASTPSPSPSPQDNEAFGHHRTTATVLAYCNALTASNTDTNAIV